MASISTPRQPQAHNSPLRQQSLPASPGDRNKALDLTTSSSDRRVANPEGMAAARNSLGIKYVSPEEVIESSGGADMSPAMQADLEGIESMFEEALAGNSLDVESIDTVSPRPRLGAVQAGADKVDVKASLQKALSGGVSSLAGTKYEHVVDNILAVSASFLGEDRLSPENLSTTQLKVLTTFVGSLDTSVSSTDQVGAPKTSDAHDAARIKHTIAAIVIQGLEDFEATQSDASVKEAFSARHKAMSKYSTNGDLRDAKITELATAFSEESGLDVSGQALLDAKELLSNVNPSEKRFQKAIKFGKKITKKASSAFNTLTRKPKKDKNPYARVQVETAEDLKSQDAFAHQLEATRARIDGLVAKLKEAVPAELFVPPEELAIFNSNNPIRGTRKGHKGLDLDKAEKVSAQLSESAESQGLIIQIMALKQLEVPVRRNKHHDTQGSWVDVAKGVLEGIGLATAGAGEFITQMLSAGMTVGHHLQVVDKRVQEVKAAKAFQRTKTKTVFDAAKAVAGHAEKDGVAFALREAIKARPDSGLFTFLEETYGKGMGVLMLAGDSDAVPNHLNPAAVDKYGSNSKRIWT